MAAHEINRYEQLQLVTTDQVAFQEERIKKYMMEHAK